MNSLSPFAASAHHSTTSRSRATSAPGLLSAPIHLLHHPQLTRSLSGSGSSNTGTTSGPGLLRAPRVASGYSGDIPAGPDPVHLAPGSSYPSMPSTTSPYSYSTWAPTLGSPPDPNIPGFDSDYGFGAPTTRSYSLRQSSTMPVTQREISPFEYSATPTFVVTDEHPLGAAGAAAPTYSGTVPSFDLSGSSMTSDTEETAPWGSHVAYPDYQSPEVRRSREQDILPQSRVVHRARRASKSQTRMQSSLAGASSSSQMSSPDLMENLPAFSSALASSSLLGYAPESSSYPQTSASGFPLGSTGALYQEPSGGPLASHSFDYSQYPPPSGPVDDPYGTEDVYGVQNPSPVPSMHGSVDHGSSSVQQVSQSMTALAVSTAETDPGQSASARPRPQCWDHGCNGRRFSTYSNFLRHQREKSGNSSKSTCPYCGAKFTRTTARNGHLAHDKCKARRYS